MISQETLSKRSFHDLREMYLFLRRYAARDRIEEQDREELRDRIQCEIDRAEQLIS